MATSGVAGIIYARTIVDLKTGDKVEVSDIVSGGESYVLPAATTTVLGGVKQATGMNNSTASDVAGLLADFNTLLTNLRAAGIVGTLN